MTNPPFPAILAVSVSWLQGCKWTGNFTTRT